MFIDLGQLLQDGKDFRVAQLGHTTFTITISAKERTFLIVFFSQEHQTEWSETTIVSYSDGDFIPESQFQNTIVNDLKVLPLCQSFVPILCEMNVMQDCISIAILYIEIT